MRGHVEKRKNASGSISYRAVVSHGPRDAREKVQRTFSTAGEAGRWSRETIRQLERGEYVASSRMSLREFVEKVWWPTKLPNISPTTARGYLSILKEHVLPHLGSRPLQSITPVELSGVISELAADGKVRQAHHVRVLLNTIFVAAVRLKCAGTNPVAAVESPRPARREMMTLTREQAVMLVEALGDSWSQIPILVLVTTGIRRSELCGLQWQDIDLDGQGKPSITIRRSYHLLPGGRVEVRSPKTARSRRPVDLDRDTKAALKIHRLRCRQESQMLGRTLQPTDYVFSRFDGTPWPPDTYSRLFNRLTRRYGIRCRLHDLRHTSASLLLDAGENPQVVAERLGHSSVAFTMDTYAHLLPGAHGHAAEKLALGARLRGMPEADTA